MKKILFLSFLCLMFAMFTNTANAQGSSDACCFYLEQMPEQVLPGSTQFNLNPLVPGVNDGYIGVTEYYYFRFNGGCLDPKTKLSIDWEFYVNGQPWDAPLNATATNPRNRMNVEFEWRLPLITGVDFQGSGPLLSGMGLQAAEEFITVNGVKRAVKTDFPGQIDASSNGTLFGYFNPYNVTPRWYNYFYADFLQWACENDYLRIKITRYSTEEVNIRFKLIERIDGFEFQNFYDGERQQNYMGGHSATFFGQIAEFEFEEMEQLASDITVCAGTVVSFGMSPDGEPYTFVANPEFPNDEVLMVSVPFYDPGSDCGNNIDSVVTLTITWKPLPVITFTSDLESLEFCFTEEVTVNFELTAEPAGGDLTYFIEYNNAMLNDNYAPTAELIISTPGQYTVMGYVTLMYPEAELGCTSLIDTLEIMAYELPSFEIEAFKNRESCLPNDTANNGWVTLTSVNEYLYAYSKNGGARVYASEGATTYTFVNLLEGNYVFYAINEETECESEIAQIIELDIENPLIVEDPEFDPIVCRGGTTTVTVTAIDGTLPYTFIHGLDTNTTGIFTLVPAGTHDFTVIDDLGCEVTVEVEITEPTLLTVSAAITTPVLCYADSAIVTVTANGGVPPYAYVLGTDTNTTNTFKLPAGTYTFKVIDNLGCEATATTLTVQDLNQKLIVTAAPEAITLPFMVCYGDSLLIHVTATGGNGEYNGTGEFWRGAGTHIFTVYDENGCSASDTVIIAQPADDLTATFVITNPILCHGDSATVTVTAAGGILPYVYALELETNTTGIFELPAGTYTITVTDSLDCEATIEVIITEPNKLVVSATIITPILCRGDSAIVMISATGGLGTYIGVGEVKIPAGTYTYSVTDSVGCMDSVTFTVTQPMYSLAAFADPLTGSLLCYGDSITVTVTATGGTGTPSEFGGVGEIRVPAGNHVLIVTDANGCTAATDTVRITQPTQLIVTAIETSAISCRTDEATVTITISGGTNPYYYQGAEVLVNPFTVQAGVGTHIFTVTDNNECVAIDSVTIVYPDAFVATAAITNPILCKGELATVTITTANGIAPIIYYLNEVGQTANTFELPAGRYAFTVIDGDSCIAVIDTITVGEPAAKVQASYVITTPILCHGDSATVTISATGGTGTITGTGAFRVAARTEPYTYYVEDAAGCRDSVTFEITQPLLPLSAYTNFTDSTLLCYGDSIYVNVNGDGGTGLYTGTGDFRVAAGNHVFTISDANGCTATTDTVRITQPIQLTASTSFTDSTLLCYGDLIYVNVSANGGTTPYSGTGNIEVAAGNHVFTVTDASGCTATTDTVRIIQPSQLIVTATLTTPILCYGDSATITVTASGGTGTITGTGTFTVAAETLPYTYTVTDANGCTATSEGIEVTQPDAPLTAEITGPVTICPETTIDLTVTATGGTIGDGYAYQWFNDGDIISGATTATINVGIGTYTVIVTDSVGCTFETGSFTITNYTDVAITITATKECYVNDIIVTVTSGVDATLIIQGYDASTDQPILTLIDTVSVTAGVPQNVTFTYGGTVDFIYFTAETEIDSINIYCAYKGVTEEAINFNNIPLFYAYAYPRGSSLYDPLDNFKSVSEGASVDHYFRVNELCETDGDLRLSVGYKYYYQSFEDAAAGIAPEPALPIGNYLVTQNGFMTFSTPYDDCGAPGATISYSFISGDAYFPHESGWRIGQSIYNYFRIAFLNDREITVRLSGFTQPGIYTIEYELVTHRAINGTPWGNSIDGNVCYPIGVIGGNNFYTGTYEKIVLATRTMTIEVLEAEGFILNISEGKTATATIYPNPATNNINIKFENVEGPAQVRIANINGQVVLDQQIFVANDVVNVNLPGIKPGVYFVNIISEKAVLTRKLVITPN